MSTPTLTDDQQVLFLAAEMAAEQGIDLAAYLDAHPDALAAPDDDDSGTIDLDAPPDDGGDE